MESKILQETIRKNFETLMRILDDAEGVRDTKVGSFSFLWDKSFVREVVSSPSLKTSIAGLKTFFSTEVLGIREAENWAKLTYKDILAKLNGDSDAKKYRFYFDFMDVCFDVGKNRKVMLEKCQVLPEDEEIRKSIADADIWIPYWLMDKLRCVVWNKLSEFFKLCDQTTCSECVKKTEVYFQFIQAVALYEIFYIEFVQEKAATYIEESMALIKATEAAVAKLGKQGELLSGTENQSAEELLPIVENVALGVQNIENGELEKKIGHVNIFQLLIAEFGISLNAMYYLLMILEAMNVSSGKFRGLKNSSVLIQNKLDKIYEKDLTILQKYNKKRATRYRRVNVKLEEILEKYAYEKYDEETVIYAFMEELCKPTKGQNKQALRGLECMLGYPVYKELSVEKEEAGD